MLLEIRIPSNNIEERRYIINYIFQDFLGLQVEVVVDGSVRDYVIVFSDKRLIIRDVFFNKHPQSLTYLLESSLPVVAWATNRFIPEEDIPILYGTNELKVSDHDVVCGIDIFAASFFMLTRWEEYVNCVRDQHERFPGIESIAYKNNFLHRPIVNEYVEMLWNMLKALDYEGERKERKFELILTHDIDTISTTNLLRTIAGDILKRKNLRLAYYHIGALFNEPVDTYSFLMQQSENLGIKSHFYFMATLEDRNEFDTPSYLYTAKFRRILKEIRKREHFIGFHPGYMTFKDEEQWATQKNELEKVLNESVFEGRQHYLRFDIPGTWAIWDKQGMRVDRTLGYADKEGFRCGTGNYFPVYYFLEGKILNLQECPLIVMDGTLRNYHDLSIEQCMERFVYYILCARKYRMPVTFLFHNSSFDNYIWKGWRKLYKEILSLV